MLTIGEILIVLVDVMLFTWLVTGVYKSLKDVFFAEPELEEN